MLIEFSATNFRSIGDKQVLSLVPDAKEDGFPENRLALDRNVALNVIAIYGANASGKSNLIKAIRTLDMLVSGSAQYSSTDPLPYHPFLLREGYNRRPTVFEISFAIEASRYRYIVAFDKTTIVEEWLFRKSTGREVKVFGREKDTIETTASLKASSLVIEAAIEATRDNALFLATCDMFNIKEAKKIIQWFSKMLVIDGLKTAHHEAQTAVMWQNEKYSPLLAEHLRSMNLGMAEIMIKTQEFDATDLPSDMPEEVREKFLAQFSGTMSYKFKALHRQYKEADATPLDDLVELDWSEHESAGSHKILQLSGPVVWALANGGVLVIDEIEAKSHPILTLALIRKFCSKETNPKGAQLIFATHDTNVLTYAPLRLDQIYFTEKNAWESTVLYSLADIESPMKGAERIKFVHKEKEKKYLDGKFGAVPFFLNR